MKNALNTKGCRGTIFTLGSELNARYFVDVDHSISFEGEDLVVKLAFDTAKEARAAWQALERTHGRPSPSPLYGRLQLGNLDSAIQPCEGHLGGVFALRDYLADASGSPEWVISEHSYSLSETTVLERSSPLVLYQRIGGGEMGQYLDYENCHLIPNALCTSDPAFSQYRLNPNNFLAMNRLLHQFFDGIECLPVRIPHLLIELVSIGDLAPTLPPRTRVTVRGHFLHGAPQLQASMRSFDDGTTFDRERGTFELEVKVLDPVTFSFCLQWKARETLERWNNHGYRDIASKIELLSLS